MSEADYYAPGSYYDPNAPWWDSDIPEKEFDVTCCQTLSKTVTVITNNYIPGAEGVDYEPDGEGGYCASGWHDPDDTSDTNWVKAYEDSAMTPLEIIDACGKIAQALLEEGKTKVGGVYLKSLVEECQDWNEDELEVVEE